MPLEDLAVQTSNGKLETDRATRYISTPLVLGALVTLGLGALLQEALTQEPTRDQYRLYIGVSQIAAKSTPAPTMAKSKRYATRRGEKPKGNLEASGSASLEEVTRAKPRRKSSPAKFSPAFLIRLNQELRGGGVGNYFGVYSRRSPHVKTAA